MKRKVSMPMHHSQPLQAVVYGMGRGEIVAPAASE